VTYNDKEAEVGFNVRYLLEGIEAVHEKKFTLEVRNGLRPAVVKPWKSRGTCVLSCPQDMKGIKSFFDHD